MRLLPDWFDDIPLQQQSVMLLALRGPDGQHKHTPFKHLLRAYRGTVLRAAKYGRFLAFGERADTFMSLDQFANLALWQQLVDEFIEDAADASILHHYTHFMHGSQILAYKHPDEEFRIRWGYCYDAHVIRLHLNQETEAQMDARLSDWNRKHWEETK